MNSKSNVELNEMRQVINLKVINLKLELDTINAELQRKIDKKVISIKR